MAEACRRAVAEGFDTIAFGDLFLRDVREYRERQLAGSGLTPLFPLWEIPTARLAREMIAAGLRARITCVDSKALDGGVRRPRVRPRAAGGPAGPRRSLRRERRVPHVRLRRADVPRADPRRAPARFAKIDGIRLRGSDCPRALSWARDMALIAVSGHPGCRFEELARITRAAAGFRAADAIAHPGAQRRGIRRRARACPDKAYPSLVDLHPGAPGHRAPPGLLRRGRRVAGAPFSGHAARARGGAGERAHRQSHARSAAWSAPPRASCCWNWKPPTAPTAKPSSASTQSHRRSVRPGAERRIAHQPSRWPN